MGHEVVEGSRMVRRLGLRTLLEQETAALPIPASRLAPA